MSFEIGSPEEYQSFVETTKKSGLLPARFLWKSKENKAKTKAEGRKICELKPYVEIMYTGTRDTAQFEVNPNDPRDKWILQYRSMWDAFIANKEQKHEGTLLASWGMIDAAMAEELNYLHLYTVEHVAEASDATIQKINGGNQLRTKAKAFIEQSKDAAAIQRYATENETLRREVDRLSARVEELAALIPNKRGPGRPPKEDGNDS